MTIDTWLVTCDMGNLCNLLELVTLNCCSFFPPVITYCSHDCSKDATIKLFKNVNNHVIDEKNVQFILYAHDIIKRIWINVFLFLFLFRSYLLCVSLSHFSFFQGNEKFFIIHELFTILNFSSFFFVFLAKNYTLHLKWQWKIKT